MSVGYNPRIVTNGLVLCLDAGNTKSYPGSGSSFTDLISNRVFSVTGASYSTSGGGSFRFTADNQRIDITGTGLSYSNFSHHFGLLLFCDLASLIRLSAAPL